MDIEKIKKSYSPMNETAFYILLSLVEKRHGYGIMQYVESLTDKKISLGAGTLYGSLSKMEKDQLIEFVDEVNKRKYYKITDMGTKILKNIFADSSPLYVCIFAKNIFVFFHKNRFDVYC